ncbi:MAG TPA: asparagine synthase (glutamine-hydrolyzing) [Vicinamibacterales bacterium]|nr:asparagine synthase (glutamine-hydrolyzing) [Vicinamibacterales bacterium]
MCGIAGFVNLDGAPADSSVLGAMTDTLRHRGPDDRGTLCVSLRGGIPDTALGFQRLKILDLTARGHQPMISPDGSTALLFNGAIYEAFEWKAELERRGYSFRTGTDTEVILALYECEGLERLLERLDGMFAIAIADTRRGVVHLLRDRVGIKPLYWAQCGTTVLFASEAKAFLAHPAFRAEIDPAHVDELLAFRYVAGEASLLKGVRHLEPGRRLTITPDGVTEARYWSIPESPDKLRLSRKEATDRLGALLSRSVQLQVRSDVKVGCQLSGGVDSSLVTVLARSHQGGDLDAFSIVFHERQFSEEQWILAAAAAAGAVSHRFVFDEVAFMGALDAASWHLDQPISHPNSLALWLLAERSHEQATVLLSGEGADELFAGYARFSDALTAADGSRRSGVVDPVDTFIRASQFHSDARLSKVRPTANLRTAIEKRRALFEEGHADHLANCVKYEMRSHLVDLLVRQDKMMMAHGVENRVPFLDRRVIEFGRALPAEHLAGPASPAGVPGTKIVVKELARRTFDAAFVDRRKSAFNLPLAQYFRSDRFVALMEDRLLPGMAARGLVDVAVVRRWWRRALSAPSTTEAFWIPVALELWAQQFIDGRGARQP